MRSRLVLWRWMIDRMTSYGYAKARKIASVVIAKIPLPLSRHIARVFAQPRMVVMEENWIGMLILPRLSDFHPQ